MATFEKREYRNKKTGKVTIRHKAKIRLKGFPYEEATFSSLPKGRDRGSRFRDPVPISSAGPVTDFPLRAGTMRHFASVWRKNLVDRLWIGGAASI